jgi:hypothetical protein
MDEYGIYCSSVPEPARVLPPRVHGNQDPALQSRASGPTTTSSSSRRRSEAVRAAGRCRSGT